MGNHKKTTYLLACGLLVALMIISLPAGAVNGTISIAYRGSGGYYIGDTIIFDGHNSFSNITLIRLTGPDLPPGGVPIYDLNADVGSGTIIPGDTSGSWKFAWYTGTIRGIEKLQTARYTLTVFDNTYPEKIASTSVLLKKPEFYVIATPDVAGFGDYVQLTGTVENGVSSANFDITDEGGDLVYSYKSSISSSGYFHKGFYIDTPPGEYTITMSSPSVRTTYRTYLTVKARATPTDVPEGMVSESGTITSGATIPASPLPQATQSTIDSLGSLSVISSPLGATVYLDSEIQGQTPIELAPVSSGNHIVEIKAPGYQTFLVQVLVNAGETKEVNTVLQKSLASTPLSIVTVIAGIIISLALILATIRRRIP